MGKRMKKVLASAMSLSMVASMAMSGVSATYRGGIPGEDFQAFRG